MTWRHPVHLRPQLLHFLNEANSPLVMLSPGAELTLRVPPLYWMIYRPTALRIWSESGAPLNLRALALGPENTAPPYQVSPLEPQGGPRTALAFRGGQYHGRLPFEAILPAVYERQVFLTVSNPTDTPLCASVALEGTIEHGQHDVEAAPKRLAQRPFTLAEADSSRSQGLTVLEVVNTGDPVRVCGIGFTGTESLLFSDFRLDGGANLLSQAGWCSTVHYDPETFPCPRDLPLLRRPTRAMVTLAWDPSTPPPVEAWLMVDEDTGL